MDFEVSVSELRSASATVGNLHQTSESLAQQLGSVPLFRRDFGVIPWLQTRVWDAYSEHTTSCNEAMQELSGTMESIHEGLDFCADSYEEFEEAAEQAVIDFFGRI